MFERLDYIYMPSPNIDESVRYYKDVLGGKLIWRIRDGETVVACISMTEDAPFILLANHLKDAPIFIYRVASLEPAAQAMRSNGCTFESGPFELPQGPCYTLLDPAGNKFAIYERVRNVDVHFLGRIDD